MKKLAFLAAICCTTLVFAQNEFYVDGAAVTIQNGALVHVDGEVIINTGSITNNGTLQLTGDWTNNVAGGLTYGGAGTRIVRFIGSSPSPQFIGGTQPTAFHNMELDNTDGGAQLDTDISVGGTVASGNNGVLTLTDGQLDLNRNRLTITNPANTGISFVAAASHIRSEDNSTGTYGVVDWEISTSTGTYTVPFGTTGLGNANIPFIFTVNTAGVDGNPPSSHDVATYWTDATATPNNAPWPTGTSPMTDAFGTPLWDKIADRFWVTNFASYDNNPVVSYTFTYEDANPQDLMGTNTLIEANLQAIYFDIPGAGWASAWPLGTDAPASNHVTGVGNVNFDSRWLLLDPAGQVLPVTLVTLAATPVNNEYINVHWVTTAEIDNLGFELQRSIDRVNFDPIAWIDGQGTTSHPVNYAHDDVEVSQAVMYYYRLKQVNLDNSFSYSNIVSAILADDTDGLLIGEFYPNPTMNLSSIDIISPDDKNVIVEVYDGLGRLVDVSNGGVGAGHNTLNVNLDYLAHGTYSVRLQIDGKSFAKRIVKLK